jgi:uncharacterized membrane protein HdeD (DUF308 family)
MPALWVVILAAILIAVGVFLLYNLDRDIADNKLLKIVLPGIVLIVLGMYLLFGNIPVEVIKKKVWGIVLSAAGFWTAFRFPDNMDHQPEAFGWTAFIFGIMLMIVGIFLVFF